MDSNPVPTLQTIADAAGVSRSTVSLALRNQPSLPAATRERIQNIAKEVGYRPNPMISTLMANLKASKPMAERGTIAFLTAYPTRDGWRQVDVFEEYFEGAVEQASRLGYRIEEFWLKEPKMTSARMTSVLQARGIVGIIIAPFPAGRGHLSLDISKFATVALGYSMTRPKLHRVANHHIESVRLALRELRHRGYRRVALVSFEIQDRRVNSNWSAGYLTFQQNLPTAHRLPICWADTMNAEGVRAWVKKYRPEAIICSAPDEVAWLKEAEIPVPDEIALAILADPHRIEGNFAGIDQQGKLTGAGAVDMIVGQIHRNERGIPEAPKVTLTEGRWVDGDTVRKAAPEDPAKAGATGRRAKKLRRDP